MRIFFRRLGLRKLTGMKKQPNPVFTAEDDLVASNLLLRTKLELEFNILVNEDLPFNLYDENYLLRYLYAVETIMKNVTRGIVQDFVGGNYYFKNDW
jgi:hypothetical protein